MKAAFRNKYGKSEVISIGEIETPVPNDNELLIKVHAATVNRSDCHVLTGKPYLMRLFLGLFKPKHQTTGSDFAGQIESVGKNVTSFKSGDKLMGFSGGLIPFGSHAQYIILTETKARKRTVPIPVNLDYPSAAACMEGAFYAVSQVEKMKQLNGLKVLVIGATGAIGSAYVQFLKFYKADVTAVCRSEHFKLVKSMGADKLIDYTKDDFTKHADTYDFIFDAVGKSSFFKCKKILNKKGRYTSSDGAINLLLLFTTKFSSKKVVFSFPKGFSETLQFIRNLAADGKFKPLIDKTYPLNQIADAYTYVQSGQKVGNVIITTN